MGVTCTNVVAVTCRNGEYVCDHIETKEERAVGVKLMKYYGKNGILNSTFHNVKRKLSSKELMIRDLKYRAFKKMYIVRSKNEKNVAEKIGTALNLVLPPSVKNKHAPFGVIHSEIIVDSYVYNWFFPGLCYPYRVTNEFKTMEILDEFEIQNSQQCREIFSKIIVEWNINRKWRLLNSSVNGTKIEKNETKKVEKKIEKEKSEIENVNESKVHVQDLKDIVPKGNSNIPTLKRERSGESESEDENDSMKNENELDKSVLEVLNKYKEKGTSLCRVGKFQNCQGFTLYILRSLLEKKLIKKLKNVK